MRFENIKLEYKVLLRLLLFIAALGAVIAFFAFAALSDDETLIEAAAVVNDERTVVILDAGHGGIDIGATSVLGTYEKNINLAVTKLVANYLRLYNVKIVLTRTTDEMLTIPEGGRAKAQDVRARVAAAEPYENPYFVSIHMNKFTDEKYSGLQVFYSLNNAESRELAGFLQSSVKNELQPENNREIKGAGSAIFVLDRLTCPAILIECGFLSNYKEAELLESEEYREELALTIASAIISYLQI